MKLYGTPIFLFKWTLFSNLVQSKFLPLFRQKIRNLISLFSGCCQTFSFHLCSHIDIGKVTESPPKKPTKNNNKLAIWIYDQLRLGETFGWGVFSVHGGVQQNYNLCGFNSRWVAPRWTSLFFLDPSLLSLLIAWVTYETGLGFLFTTYHISVCHMRQDGDEGQEKRRREEKQVGGVVWLGVIRLPVATFILMPYHNGRP